MRTQAEKFQRALHFLVCLFCWNRLGSFALGPPPTEKNCPSDRTLCLLAEKRIEKFNQKIKFLRDLSLLA